MTDQPTPTRAARSRLTTLAVGGIAGIAVGLAAVYGIGAMQRNPAEAACKPAAQLAKRLSPLARGEVAAVGVAADPKRLPELTFLDADGKARALSEFRGKTVLMNLWATWCVPCRKEMPALDALQARLGGDTFAVLAVNIDTRNLDKPKAWLQEVGINRLSYFADPSAKVFQDLKAAGKAFGMPTTLLIDREGCELGVLAGPAEWASEDAIKLIEAAIAPIS